MFDRPGLALLITFATLPNFTAFALAVWLLNKFGADYFLAYLMAFFVGVESLYAIIMHLGGEFIVWNNNLSTDNPRSVQPVNPAGPRRIPNMNDGMYGQVVQAVKFDAVKNCCQLILSMHEQGMEVNLTEEFWLTPFTLRSGKKHKRWQGKNKEFQEWKKREEGLIFGRESDNSNARFVIRDETRLRQAAEGRLR